MDGTLDPLSFDRNASLFLKKPIALIGCRELFSARVQRTLSAEFPQNAIDCFDTLGDVPLFSGEDRSLCQFELSLIDARTFVDLVTRETLHGVLRGGAKLAVVCETDAAQAYLLENYQEQIARYTISLLPVHISLQAWLCMLGLVANGVQYIPAFATLAPAPTEGTAGTPHATPPAKRDDLPRLTKRESEVLQAISSGKPNKLIAVDMEISEHTVKLHIHRVISKLRVKNRTEAAAIYFKHPEICE